MVAHKFTRPGSLDGSLEQSKFEGSDMEQASAQSVKESFSPAQQEPLAQDGVIRKPGITFAHQDKLPKLPIPELESSLKKYRDVLQPLQGAREQADTAAAVEEFLKAEGPELQSRLKKYATGKTSYIEQFWYDSYLNFDNSVVLNLNPFFLLEDDPTPARNNQVTRAASLIVSALCFVRAVRKEELPPDTIRGQPLCMYQFSRLFGTARVPTDNGCHIAQDGGSKHVVMACKGQFYWFDVLDDNADLIMSEKDLAINLQVIIDDAEKTPTQEAARGALGVLSTENRKIWAGLRDVLTRDGDSNNAECLNTVDSAIFIVCLDYTEPASPAELCGNMLCGTSEVVKGVQVGTCTNRWYDKMQIIVCKNGSAGINFEHTGVDGHTVLRFASDLYTDTILRFARSINGLAPTLWASNSPDPSKRDPESFGDVSTTPHKLEWDMLPELSTALRFAETRLADLIQQNEFQTLEFGGYGKNFMTSMGFSPDAFVQMAFQAAYYGLYGRVENTYEPAMTKVFLHGRTEAIRAISLESADFVRTFWAEKSPAEKIEKLRKACDQHTKRTKDCAKAQGQDRHLYALYCVWQRAVDEDGAEAASSNGFSSDGYASPTEDSTSSPNRRRSLSKGSDNDANPIDSSRSPSRRQHQPSQAMPALFADAGWDKINNTILSTSNCGNPALRHFGFGPTSGEGFGIGYIIKDDTVSICASSKHRQTKRFVDAIESYFQEIRKLLRGGGGGTKSKHASRAREAERVEVLGRKGRVVGQGKEVGSQDHGDEEVEDDEDGLGGYGFFDAGMLLQALKANQDEKDRPNENSFPRRPTVGKKLTLREY
ncbi:uncharacterized protein KY384_000225 [Bacidia gigantensis]|uniref:uncharacterized protein n=1 Tax=Bacidia gigantensis TaxID=2732470 RepID=UPI001D04FFC2|nr:uncharacterized protein KY384_000225 [Bacidia gigantensis]KAG8526232.1 hypothetical protein KY384_000225 [Bacidia gigantensis]